MNENIQNNFKQNHSRLGKDFSDAIFLFLPLIALMAVTKRKIINAVPPTPTTTAAASEPLQDKLQDNAARR